MVLSVIAAQREKIVVVKGQEEFVGTILCSIQRQMSINR